MTNNNNPVQNESSAFNKLGGKLSVLEKVGFGFGDTASNILFQAWNFFLPFFYVNVFGLEPKVGAKMFLVTRILDMITDPIMGSIADRTNTRWGKFRPYILFMAVPFGVLAFGMFVTPDWSYNMKVVYAYASYILATIAYTAINIPYSSMMAVMTPNPKERTTLSQYRFFLAFIGQLLITTFMLPLAQFFGNNPSHKGYNPELGYSEALGYQITMGVFGGISILLLVITFLTTRERVKPPKDQQSDFWGDIGDVFKNKPWIIIFSACFFWLIHNMLRNGTVKFYFDFVNGEGSKVLFSVFGLDFNQTTTFLTVVTFGMLAGVLLCTPIKRILGKKPAIIAISIGLAIINAVFYWLPADNFILLCIVNALWAMFSGALPVFLFSIFADVTDFHEWKFKKRATGLVTAGVMIAIKLGVAIGGFLNLYILGLYGYKKDAAITPEVVGGIKSLFSLFPAIFILICGIILIFYPVDEKMLAKIEIDLKERKENE